MRRIRSVESRSYNNLADFLIDFAVGTTRIKIGITLTVDYNFVKLPAPAAFFSYTIAAGDSVRVYFLCARLAFKLF